MKLALKNKYFFLRHGKNIHQTEKKGIVYYWPDDNPPCSLIEEGIEEVKRSGEILKDKGIDQIFCSDILRTRQTAKIVSDIIGFDSEKIIYDTRLRDLNWGDFGGKKKDDLWAFYDNEKMRAFEGSLPNGESWNQCRERMVNVLNEIENNYQNKNILIVSHGDALWLLEGYIKGTDDQTLLDNRARTMIQTGELREIYE